MEKKHVVLLLEEETGKVKNAEGLYLADIMGEFFAYVFWCGFCNIFLKKPFLLVFSCVVVIVMSFDQHKYKILLCVTFPMLV